MADRYKHLREKAVQLRREEQLTLTEIVERLKLPKTTIYGWIRHIPIERTSRQTEAQQRGTATMQKIYAARREDAYQVGWEQAPELLSDPLLRDFVVLYIAEGYKRSRNQVAIGNADASVMQLAYIFFQKYGNLERKLEFLVQIHIDHDEADIQTYWATILGIKPEQIKIVRKSNSGQLKGRRFRSEHGVMTIRLNDTYFRAKLQAWIDYLQQSWRQNWLDLENE